MAFPFDVLSWLVRARYKLTPPAATDGETIELQATVNDALKVSSEAPAPEATPAPSRTRTRS